MTYSPFIPTPSISPKDSAPQIQTNFSQYATKFAQNHTLLNSSFAGDHEKVILTKQGANPGVVDDLAVLFCKDTISNLGTQPQLFSQILKFLPNSKDTTNASNTPVQLTYNQVNVVGPVFQTFLPGGNLLYFGSGTSATSPVTITLSPVGTKILIAIANSNSVTTIGTPVPVAISTGIISTSQFNIYLDFSGGPANIAFNWLSIASV